MGESNLYSNATFLVEPTCFSELQHPTALVLFFSCSIYYTLIYTYYLLSYLLCLPVAQRYCFFPALSQSLKKNLTHKNIK